MFPISGMTSKFFLAMYPLILMCALAFENQSYYRHLLGASDSNCSKVLKFDSTNMLAGPNKLDLIGVKGISYSIGYSVIDAVKNLQASGNPDDACLIRLATVINKYGVAVAASAEGAQAAIRGTNINNINIQSCPGFGNLPLLLLKKKIIYAIILMPDDYNCPLQAYAQTYGTELRKMYTLFLRSPT